MDRTPVMPANETAPECAGPARWTAVAEGVAVYSGPPPAEKPKWAMDNGLPFYRGSEIISNCQMEKGSMYSPWLNDQGYPESWNIRTPL